MERLTTENPKGNTEIMLNIVFVKDNEAWLRRTGENGEDISLINYCIKEHKDFYGYEFDGETSAEEFGEYMDGDDLFCTFYWACVGFAEVRHRLIKYEDESEKIRMTCTKPCHMGKDIKLIEREYNEGHEPYGEILAQYERQLETCPKICSNYKPVV
jgi:hypothetical protein